MDCDDQVLSTTVTFELVKQFQSFSLCQVCGTEKAQTHYGALCCASCKMFFRRNAKFDLVRKYTDFLSVALEKKHFVFFFKYFYRIIINVYFPLNVI